MQDPAPDFSVAFEASLAELRREICDACVAEEAWPRRVAAAVAAAFAFAAHEPNATQVLTVDPTRNGKRGFEAAEQLNATFAEQLRHLGSDLSPSEGLTEPALIGGVVSLVRRRATIGALAALPSLVAEVAQFLLVPYLGAEQARRIASEWVL